MAFTTTTNLPLKLPVPGSREPAQIALINENMVAVDAHDHTTGKAVAVGRLRSGLEANRPAAGQAGNVYFATDTGKFYVDSGAAWVEFLTTGGTSTITGWTLVDPIIRDTLNFGPEPTGTPDATLSRTGPGALRLGDTSPMYEARASGATSSARFGQHYPNDGLVSGNARHDGTDWHLDDTTKPGVGLTIGAANPFQPLALYLLAAGSNPATARAKTALAVSNTGTLSLTPDAGQPALHANVGAGSEGLRATFVEGAGGTFTVKYAGGIGAGYTRIDSLVGGLALAGAGGFVLPAADNTYASGHPSYRWTTLYAVAGTINASSAQAKEALRPLSPAACYQAAKDVRWYEFAYLPPAYTEPEPPPDIAYDAADDNETKADKKARRDEAEAQAKAAHLKMVAETAPARHQRGFVFPAGPETKDEAGGTLPPVPELFGLSDRESTTPQADIATLGAALQHLITKVEALEAASGQAPA